MRLRFIGFLFVPLVLLACTAQSNHEGSLAVDAQESASPSTAAPAPSDSPPPRSTPPPGSLGPAEHDGQRTLAHIEKLANGIGPRVSGTKGEADAAAYIADRFRADGYDVELMEFTFDGDRFRAGTVSGIAGSFSSLTLAGSGGGTVAAPAIFIGLGDVDGIGGRSLEGKIAVSDRGTLRFGEKYEAARDAGAVALVILNNQPGPFSGDLRISATFPVVAIAGEDSDALRNMARAGATLKVDAPDGKTTRAVNVIARPSRDEHCQVLVGGHHDSVPGTGGANDNASGAATVIELARAFAADGLDSGLCFATFGAEESGLYGSAALVRRLTGERRLPALMVNLDVTGIGPGVIAIGDKEYREKAMATAADLGIQATQGFLPDNFGSDHQSFERAGVRVLYFEAGAFDTIHTPRDVVAAIEVDELERVGDLAFAVIGRSLADIARSQGRS